MDRDAKFTAAFRTLLAGAAIEPVRLLIDRVDYQGENGELPITFSAAGAKLLATDVVL